MLDNLNTKTKILIILAAILFVIAVPLTIIQVQKQQSLKQRAGGGPLRAEPAQDSKVVGDSFSVQLYLLNYDRKDISAVDVTLTYDSNIMELSDFKSSQIFTTIPNDTAAPGTVRYTGVNPTKNPISDTEIALGILTFKGSSPGTGNLNFVNLQVTASGESGFLPITASLAKIGSYNISVVSAGTPQTPTYTPTSVPAPTLAAINLQTCKASCLKPENYEDNFTQDAIAACEDSCDRTYGAPTAAAPTATPTLAAAAPAPTNTPVPAAGSQTKLALSFALSEIGDTAGRNNNPKKRNTIPVKLQLTNVSTKIILPEVTQTFTYNPRGPNAGLFTGTFNLDASVTSGNYIAKIKPAKYLRRQLASILTLTAGIENQALISKDNPLLYGDVDEINELNASFYGTYLVNCFENKADRASCPNKAIADLNDDDVIDGIDVNAFIKSLKIRQGD